MASSSTDKGGAHKKDLFSIQREYFKKMTSEVSGMKVLILDKETTGIISMVFSLTEIMSHEVFLVDKLENEKRETMQHLKALVFVRPTRTNIELLQGELQRPKYGEYHIFFSNILNRDYLEELAESDEREIVQQVHEYYADYFVVNKDLFTLGVPSVLKLQQPSTWDKRAFDRICDGISSFLLSIKTKPSIRFQQSSDLASRLAKEINLRIDADSSLFDFRRSSAGAPPLLLLVDRREDPVTPLLSQWTYQAMVHELLGISRNKVDLAKSNKDISKDVAQVVLSVDHDDFWKRNMFKNFGEICEDLKSMVDQYQDKMKITSNIQTLEDLKHVVEQLPEFRKESGQVTKHVAIVGELNRAVEQRALLDVSELEQELACSDKHSESYRKLEALLADDRVDGFDATRLVLLYALRYERDSRCNVAALIDMLLRKGVSAQEAEIVSAVLKFAGASQRSLDLFGKQSITGFTKGVLRSLKGVQNVYTQHEPLLVQLVDMVTKNKLSEKSFPYILGSPSKERVTEIILFVIGGCTYEEALHVNRLNESGLVHITLGSTTIHNSTSYLEDLVNLCEGAQPDVL